MATDLDLVGLTTALRLKGKLVSSSGNCPECDHILAMVELLEEDVL